MAATNTSVENIKPTDVNFCVVARVIRMWSVSDLSRGRNPFSLELVLMDRSGDRIAATVKKQLIYRFQRDLQEGVVYKISNFSVGTNSGAYRATRHQYKINFQYNTVVQRDNNDQIPQMIYHFTNPSVIFQSGYDTDFLVDCMGMLTGVGTEREIQKDGVKTKLNIIELDHDGFKFKVTLFGTFVDELNSFLASGDVDNVVIAVLYAKAKIFGGRTVLQNSVYASKVIYNLNTVEATSLKNRMIEQNLSPVGGISQIHDATRVSVADDFLNISVPATIDVIKGYLENATFVVVATVDSVATDTTWWYNACNVCQRKVYPDSNLYYCETCVRHVVLHTPRYRLNLRVIDSTDSAVFTLFDRDASQLLGRSCADLLQGSNQVTANGIAPPEFDLLVGRELLFKVEVSPQRNARFERTFSVRRFTSDVEVIDKFKKQSGVDAISSAEPATAELINGGVNQDLMERFTETTDNTAKDKLVLPVNSDDCVFVKRPFEAMEKGQGSGTNSLPPKVPKRIIKVEKD